MDRFLRVLSVGLFGTLVCIAMSAIFDFPLFYLLLGYYGGQFMFEVGV